MRLFKLSLLGIFLAAFWSCSDLGDEVNADCAGIQNGTTTVDECGECGGDNSSCVNYSTEIQPIFSTNSLCTGCHGTSGGLSLTSYENLMLGNSNNGPVVNAGNGANSLIIQKLRGTAGSQMPMGDCCLEDESIDLIETWIDEGAQNN